MKSATQTTRKGHKGAGIALFQIVLGLMCLGGLSGGGESQNEAKSRRFGMDLPSRAFYEGVNPKTILNNSHEYTKMHLNSASPPIAFCHHRQRNLLPTTPFDFAITLSAGWCCPITHREKREAKWQIQGLKLTHSMKHYPLQISNHMPKHLIKQDPFDLSAENGQKTDYLCISL